MEGKKEEQEVFRDTDPAQHWLSLNRPWMVLVSLATGITCEAVSCGECPSRPRLGPGFGSVPDSCLLSQPLCRHGTAPLGTLGQRGKGPGPGVSAPYTPPRVSQSLTSMRMERSRWRPPGPGQESLTLPGALAGPLPDPEWPLNPVWDSRVKGSK